MSMNNSKSMSKISTASGQRRRSCTERSAMPRSGAAGP